MTDAPAMPAQHTPSAPRFTWLAGALFAVSFGTTMPGLSLLFSSFERRAPDLRALVCETATGLVFGAFGATQLRAQLLGRGRWTGTLFALALLALVGAMGVALDLDLSAGSTDSGPAMLLGLVVVLVIVVAHGLVAGALWFLLAALAKRLARDLAEPDGEAQARETASAWVFVTSGMHVVIKTMFAGPVVLGTLASAIACLLLLPRGRGLRAPLAWGLAIVALGVTVSFALIRRDLR